MSLLIDEWYDSFLEMNFFLRYTPCMLPFPDDLSFSHIKNFHIPDYICDRADWRMPLESNLRGQPKPAVIYSITFKDLSPTWRSSQFLQLLFVFVFVCVFAFIFVFVFVFAIHLQKKKSGVKKCLEICAIKGGADAQWQMPFLISILLEPFPYFNFLLNHLISIL